MKHYIVVSKNPLNLFQERLQNFPSAHFVAFDFSPFGLSLKIVHGV